MSGQGPAPLGPLALFLAVLLAQRTGELIHSAANTRRLVASGAREHGAGHLPLIVMVHVLFPLCLASEVVFLGARPGRLWVMWLVLWLGAQALRLAAVRALGERWSVRILVLPGAPLVRRGPYRVLRHPNYLAVVIELLAGPLMFGAWRTAIAISLLDLVALGIRIRVEETALRSAPPVQP
ncbi:MAG: isoprenylcysteine carboxyl methyltransferase family protein [Candidatus Eisenbacteria bacterium]